MQVFNDFQTRNPAGTILKIREIYACSVLPELQVFEITQLFRKYIVIYHNAIIFTHSYN